jgi:DDE family transposase
MRDGFKQEVSERLPLAQAALEAFGFAFDPQLLNGLYDRNRGRGYTDTLTFPHLVGLVRSCLLEHGGSGHRGCTEAERDGTLEVDESSFYRKLAKMPVAVSRALLCEGTVRLRELCEGTSAVTEDFLPACFEGMEPVVLDGKKIKKAARRLKLTRGYKGALIGAKALVAMSLRSGMALAMSDSLDGQTNDVPLIPELLPQVRQVIAGPILWLADRQFGGLGIPPQLTARAGDHYVLRVSVSTPFTADPMHKARICTDEHDRVVIDEIGTFGSKDTAIKVRRVTLRTGKPASAGGDVILITDLTDSKVYSATKLLKLYRRRWGIEQMFQEVTETFSLDHLIGCAPKAVLFQFAFCLLMYNLTQVLKRHVAADGGVSVSIVSTRNLFYDLRRELIAWNYLELDAPDEIPAEADAMRRRLAELLKGIWDPKVYTKASDKTPRTKPKRKSLHGGHTSIQKILDGKVKVRVTKS